jgi:putative DNA primase/helicase
MTSARELTTRLGGQWRGGRGMARCPCHDDKRPSFLVKDGHTAPLFKCFAGCNRREIVAALRDRGLLHGRDPARRVRTCARDSEIEQEAARKLECAKKIWRQAQQTVPGTVAEQYLRNRGIVTPIPPSIRAGDSFDRGGCPRPRLVAAVQSADRRLIGVQETFLTAEGKKAPIANSRLITGTLGDGAVRLAKAGAELGLAEGIEDALSVMQLTGTPCWCSLGAGRLDRVAIPDDVHELIVFADNDDVGRRAAERVVEAHQKKRRDSGTPLRVCPVPSHPCPGHCPALSRPVPPVPLDASKHLVRRN